MKIHLAHHYGMCFGVRDALRSTHTAAKRRPVTLLGQLVHNEEVDRDLDQLGVRRGSLDDLASAATNSVVISAHGTSDRMRQKWQETGHQVIDTTCPLVRKAHDALSLLVNEGYHPVIIGQATHIEVRGMTGDHPQASVILDEADIQQLPDGQRFGVIAQTTQPLDRVLQTIEAIRAARPGAEIRFIDTVCRPTKQRQTALDQLCQDCDLIIVIGGSNSNNTRQLTDKAIRHGCRAHRVTNASELQPEWFQNARHVGVTAGTSTLDETVDQVVTTLRRWSFSQRIDQALT